MNQNFHSPVQVAVCERKRMCDSTVVMVAAQLESGR